MKFFYYSPTVDIQIFATAIEDLSENSAEDIPVTQQDIDKMIVQYPAIRGSSKSVINWYIIASIAVAAVMSFVLLITLIVKMCRVKDMLIR